MKQSALLVFSSCCNCVFGMIILGIKSESYGELEKQEINMSFQDLQDLQKKHTKFQSQFGVSIAFGVFL